MVSAQNAGWSVGRIKRTLRFSVYVSVIVLLILSTVSIWYEFGGRITYVWKIDPDRYDSARIEFDSGRVSVGYIPNNGYEMLWEPKETGWDTHIWSDWISRYMRERYPNRPFYPEYNWWGTPSYSRAIARPGGVYSELSIPLVYPTAVSSIWAWVIWRRQRRIVMAGRCQSCGYSLEGLPTTTCPECGVERA